MTLVSEVTPHRDASRFFVHSFIDIATLSCRITAHTAVIPGASTVTSLHWRTPDHLGAITALHRYDVTCATCVAWTAAS